MIALSLQQLASILNAQLIGADAPVPAITIDTRQITAGCLFIALKGEQFDGHDFADKAQAAGAGALLVSRELPIALPQLVVADTRLALGQIGAWVRQQSTAKVVALTGSSGKTSVKEMTASILQQCGKVLYTAGNFNNDIGVPLTLIRLLPEHDFAVIELGANHIGEIAYTVGLAKPQSALVNNLAAAHLEGFGSLAGVATAKGEIFAGLPVGGTAIINSDNNDLPRWQPDLDHKQLWRFGVQHAEGADFYATDISVSQQGTNFTLHSPQGQIAICLPLPGRHNISNALAAAALAQSVGASLLAIQQGLQQLSPVAGRLFPLQLAPGKLLIDDTYNANVGSMIAATQVLAEMPGYRIMVVGDMGELGEHAEACHREVGEAARQAGIDHLLSVGKLSALISQANGGEHFQDQRALVARLSDLLSQHALVSVLIKGSRSAAMEQVVRALQENAPC